MCAPPQLGLEMHRKLGLNEQTMLGETRHVGKNIVFLFPSSRGAAGRSWNGAAKLKQKEEESKVTRRKLGIILTNVASSAAWRRGSSKNPPVS